MGFSLVLVSSVVNDWKLTLQVLGQYRVAGVDIERPPAHNENTMQKTEKFFIFSWKELTVIGLLFLISVGFFFTLGLHYGKKLTNELAPVEHASKLEESPETLPPRETLDEGAQHANSVTQETIKATTDEEVGQAGLKVDAPKPVDLPAEKAAVVKAFEKKEAQPEEKPAEEPAAASENKFAIQLGSYPAKKEAQMKIKGLVKRGLHPDIRTAVVAGQTRYRVVLTGFKSRHLADQKGKELKQKRKIESFVVIKSE
jgi:cell division septation protein DedD